MRSPAPCFKGPRRDAQVHYYSFNEKKLDKRMQLLARVFGLVRPAPQHSSDKAQDTLVRAALLSSRRHCS